MIDKRQIWRTVPSAMAAIACVLAIRLAGANAIDGSDGLDYAAAARALLDHGSYPDVSSLPFFRPPLYPFVIALTWAVIPGSVLAVKLVQSALFVAATYMVGGAVADISGREEAGFWAGLVFGLNPILVYTAVLFAADGVQLALMTAAFVLLVRMAAFGFKKSPALASGVLLGLAALCKPSALGVAGVLVAVVAWMTYRSALAYPALVAVGTLAVVIPWSLYVLGTKHEFFLVNDAGGFAFWLGNIRESLPVYEGTFETPADALAYSEYLGKVLPAQQIARFEETAGYSARTLKERENLWWRAGLANIQADPSTAAKLFGYKLLTFWRPWLNSNVYGRNAFLGSLLVLVPLYVLAVVGMVLMRRQDGGGEMLVIFCAVAVFVTVVHVVLVSSMRYRLPYIEPFLAMFAGIGIAALRRQVASWFARGSSGRDESESGSMVLKYA